jgi:hypothetical protein
MWRGLYWVAVQIARGYASVNNNGIDQRGFNGYYWRYYGRFGLCGHGFAMPFSL